MTLQLSGTSGVPVAALQFFVGAIQSFPATVAPVGWIAASGQLVSRTTYAALWSFAQASGNLAANDGAWTAGQFSPGNGSTTFRIPEYRGEFMRFWDNGRGVDTGRAIGATQADVIKTHTHPMRYSDGANGTGGGQANLIGNAGVSSFSTDTNPAGSATETRPRNIAVLGCIFTGV